MNTVKQFLGLAADAGSREVLQAYLKRLWGLPPETTYETLWKGGYRRAYGLPPEAPIDKLLLFTFGGTFGLPEGFSAADLFTKIVFTNGDELAPNQDPLAAACRALLDIDAGSQEEQRYAQEVRQKLNLPSETTDSQAIVLGFSRLVLGLPAGTPYKEVAAQLARAVLAAPYLHDKKALSDEQLLLFVYCESLGLSPDASEEELMKAWEAEKAGLPPDTPLEESVLSNIRRELGLPPETPEEDVFAKVLQVNLGLLDATDEQVLQRMRLHLSGALSPPLLLSLLRNDPGTSFALVVPLDQCPDWQAAYKLWQSLVAAWRALSATKEAGCSLQVATARAETACRQALLASDPDQQVLPAVFNQGTVEPTQVTALAQATAALRKAKDHLVGLAPWVEQVIQASGVPYALGRFAQIWAAVDRSYVCWGQAYKAWQEFGQISLHNSADRILTEADSEVGDALRDPELRLSWLYFELAHWALAEEYVALIRYRAVEDKHFAAAMDAVQAASEMLALLLFDATEQWLKNNS